MSCVPTVCYDDLLNTHGIFAAFSLNGARCPFLYPPVSLRASRLPFRSLASNCLNQHTWLQATEMANREMKPEREFWGGR